MSDTSAPTGNLSPQEKRALLAQLLQRQAQQSPSVFPLSYGQQALWLTHQLAPESWAYHVLFSARIRSQVNIPALQRVLQALVERHPSLRTTYLMRDGTPVQHVQAQQQVHFETVDVSSCKQEAVRSYMLDKAQQPFNLEEGPLIRVHVFTRAVDDHFLLLTVHHIAIDAWSLGVLLDELRQLYTAEQAGVKASLPALARPYTDYVQWQAKMLASPEGEQLWAYWQQRLVGELPVLQLPTDRPRPPVQTYRGASHTFTLTKKLTMQLNALAKAEVATLYMTLLAAFYVLLHRYTNQEDILVGAFMAGQMQPEFRKTVGYFVNPVVLRADLSGHPTFKTFLSQVRRTLLEALKHQDFPFPLLVERLQSSRDASRSPLFQVAFVLHNLPHVEAFSAYFVPGTTGTQLDFGGLVLTPFALAQQEGQFDLTLEMAEVDASLYGAFKYNPDLFDATTIARMAGHLQRLLAGIVNNPDQHLVALPMLTEAECAQLLVAWNHTQRTYPLHDCLHQLVEAQVERTPEAVAVVFEDTQLTYRELNRRANYLAHHLQSLGVTPETLVGICVERSLDMVIGLLGILKAGGAYVPLEPTYPQERLAFMLEDAQVSVLLTQERWAARLPAHGAQTVYLDADWETVARASEANPYSEVSPDNLAYVIYTSGSTGRPKGAMISHRGICNRLFWMQEAYSLTPADRVLQKTPFSFDVSVWEFFWPLLTGARLVVARPGGHQDSTYLVALIAAQHITTLHFVPSMLQVFVDTLGLETCSSLRRVICSGEPLPYELQERFFARLGAALHNLYGPTEASVDVTFWACARQSSQRTVPIGRPIANTQIYLLDMHLQPVPIGIPGELYIGGVGLARGYLGRPELTAEKFVPHPFGNEPGERLYKTGDLARYLPNGAIEFLNRVDDQVKMRGFRIELGEVEAVLRQHPTVREAIVTVWEDSPTGKHLVAYVVPYPGHAPTIDQLRRFLEEKLPPYMLPSASVILDAVPLTANGKVNRRALPAPEARTRPELERPFVAPQTPVEAELARIWSQELGVDRVGIYDNFFDLGGDSIRSIRIGAQAQAAGLDLSIPQLFRAQTIHALAREISTTAPNALPLPQTETYSLMTDADRLRLPDDIEDAYPLATLQAGMLFHSRWRPHSAMYHDVFSFHLTLPFDLPGLQQTAHALASRHPVLRTAFDLTSYSEPLQLVHRHVVVPLHVEDLRDLAPPVQEQALAAWREEEASRDFDWNAPPLLRFFVHRRSDASLQFTLSFHHAILDGWSVASMLTEFFASYLAGLHHPSRLLLPPPLATYRDFIALERLTLQSEQARRYWEERLQDYTISSLPKGAAGSRGDQHQKSGVLSVPLADRVCQGLSRLAHMASVPLKTVLLAAHLRAMSLLSGQADVLTGVVSNGRLEVADGERALGLFLNTIPCRLHLRGGTWIDLVRQTFKTEQEAFPFRRYPLAELQRMRGGPPLFETIFSYTHFHIYRELERYRALKVLGVETFEQTNFTLYVHFACEVSSASITLSLHYDVQALSGEQLQAFSGYYSRILEEMAGNPLQHYASACLLSAAERQRLLVQWNDTKTAYPDDLCIHERFESQAAHTPDALAVIWQDRSLTYAELNRRANQLAHALRALGVGPNVRVGICVERSLEMVVGLLGILKAGGTYVPLEPAYPQERLRFMLEDAGIPVLLTQSRLRHNLPPHRAQVVCLDAAWEGTTAAHDVNPSSGAMADHLAYVIYTSGSTGKPKGVEVPHRGVLRLVCGVDYVQLNATQTLLQMAPISFDASTFELWGALLHGARCVLFPESVLTPKRLGEVLQEYGIQTLWLTASLFNTVIDEAPEVLGSVQQLLIGGEALSVVHVRRALACLPGTQLINGYGPTESTTFACCYPIPRQLSETTASIPIGRPIGNTQVYLLDRHLQPVPVGVAGEIYIGGDGLAQGYLNRPELTAETFIPHPFSDEPGARLYKTGDLARYLPDGAIEFLGRLDGQVKIRGFRIELGEIETVLRQHAAVRDAVVVAREESPGRKRLVAYLVSAREAAPLPDELRRDLKQKLPDYMIPATFVWLDALPCTPNGKMDRGALPVPALARPALPGPSIAPRTPIEEMLVDLWTQVLDIAEVGIHDDFFELGGHSLLAVQLMCCVQQTFGRELPLATLFQAPTVATLAVVLERGLDASRHVLVPIQPNGTRPPLFCIHPAGGHVLAYRPLAAFLGLDQPLYGLQSRALTQATQEHATLDAMALDYADAIRKQQPAGPYYLLGWSMGGVLAMAIAAVLERQGQRVAFVGLIDVYVPSDAERHYQHDPLLGLILAFGGPMASALTALSPAEQQALRATLLGLSPMQRLQWIAAWGRERQLVPAHLPLAILQRQVALCETHVALLGAHTVTPLQASLHIWWASDDLQGGEPHRHWRPYTQGTVAVEIATGNHFSMMQVPHIHTLAARLQEVLQSVAMERPYRASICN